MNDNTGHGPCAQGQCIVKADAGCGGAGGRLYTLAEVAAKIHKSPRWLREFLRQHDDCCLRIGRTPEFDDAMVARLISRIDKSCRSSSTRHARRVQVRHLTGQSAARTSESALAEALSWQARPCRPNPQEARARDRTWGVCPAGRADIREHSCRLHEGRRRTDASQEAT